MSKYRMNLLQLLESKIFDVPADWLHDGSTLVSRIQAACKKERAKYFRFTGVGVTDKIRSVNKLGSDGGMVYLTTDKRYICIGYPREEMQKIRVSPNMKNVVLRTILKCIKHDIDDLGFIRAEDIIHICRKLGYDYPEFKAIEKSLKENR